MYIDELPEINQNSYFLVKKEAYTQLSSDWLDYVDFVIQNFGLEETSNDKNYFSKLKQTYIGGSKNFITNSDKVKETLGLGGAFEVLREVRKSNGYEYEIQMNYNELTNLFFSKEILKTRYIQRQQIIDKFFLFQWSKGVIQYPMYLPREVINRTASNKEFMENSNVYQEFSKWIDNKQYSGQMTSSLMKATLLNIIVGTSWQNLKNITENGISTAESLVFTKDLETSSKGKNSIYVLNELRRMLIFYGRKDIQEPLYIRNKKAIASNTTNEAFDFVDLQIFPNLESLVKKGRTYINVLALDGLAKGTIKSIRLHLNHFFRYLIANCKNKTIDIKTVNEMFDPDNSLNLKHYLESLDIATATALMQNIIKFLDYCELASAYAKNHIPKFTGGAKYPFRKAMPNEMLRHLIDILINRPPNSQTTWQPNNVDISWWKHKDVFPIFPLMMLFNLMIPLRGGQIRHLCREKSFYFNETGEISHFIINTDKNTRRVELQSIDNVWSELDIFKDFLIWHKQYFPNLLPIKYQDDDNSPWEDIIPLFIVPGRFRPISQRTHYAYLKKLLCIYQIEKNQELIKLGKSPYINVVKRSDNQPIFENIADAQNASLAIFDKYYKSEYDVHSLRVTGVTRYLEAGLNFKMVMMLTGHKTPAMVLDTYNRLDYEERQTLLSSAYKKVFLGVGENMVQNTQEFVYGELGELYRKDGADGLENGFTKNGLFSLQRKSISNSSDLDKLELGTTIAKQSDPSTWFAMTHGICPGVQCPEGREKKCSLCPYLISGRVFFDGIVHQTNMAMIRFFRLSRDGNEEFKTSHYENKPKNELLEATMEEILGWNEILSKIEAEIHQEQKYSDKQHLVLKDANTKLLKTVTLPEEIVYLENEFRAKMMGVEIDKHSLAMLTIRAFQFARNVGDELIYEIANDGKKVVDYLMGYYEKSKNEDKLLSFTNLLCNMTHKSTISHHIDNT